MSDGSLRHRFRIGDTVRFARIDEAQLARLRRIADAATALTAHKNLAPGGYPGTVSISYELLDTLLNAIHDRPGQRVP